MAFVKKSSSSTINKSTPSAWKTSLLQSLIDGNSYIVFNTSGEKPRPETATTAGRGMQTTKALAKTHTVNVQDMQGVVSNNIDFYNDMLSNSSKFDFYYFTPGRIWDASGSYVTVIGDPVITAELNTYQMAEVSITWVSKTNPLPYTFDTDEFLEGLFFSISATGSWASFDWYTPDCAVFSPDLSAAINVDGLTVPSTLTWSFGDSATETSPGSGLYQPINWAGSSAPIIQINSSGIVTVSPDLNGIGSFTVQVSTPNGCVFGQQEVNLRVEGCD